VAAEIALLGDELDAVLCVMGQHRRSRVGRLLFGSVAAEVLRVTARPLLLVLSAADWPPTRVRWDRRTPGPPMDRLVCARWAT
jgi:hypothetical protein